MIIQFNTGQKINVSKGVIASSTSLINDELKWINGRISKVVVYLSEENGSKDEQKDMSCRLEARLKGAKEFAATDHSTTIEMAVIGAIARLRSSIKTHLWRTRSY